VSPGQRIPRARAARVHRTDGELRGVAAAIEAAVAERAERTNVTQDSVIAELATIAFSDMRMYAHWGPHWACS
jgi:hypothetical protein